MKGMESVFQVGTSTITQNLKPVKNMGAIVRDMMLCGMIVYKKQTEEIQPVTFSGLEKNGQLGVSAHVGKPEVVVILNKITSAVLLQTQTLNVLPFKMTLII
jgi:hypothetical protein